MNPKFLTGVLLLITVNACVVYHPQSSDIPLIDKKNDLRIDGGISIIPSAQATISYGLTKNLALQTFGSIGFDHRYYFQMAPGLYKSLGNQNVIEFYTGFGYGYANIQHDPLASDIWEYHGGKLFGNYQLYFAQFNWGKKRNQTGGIDWGFGIKTGLFHSNLTDLNYFAIYSDTGPFPAYKHYNILIEPMWFFRTGSERIKFSYKLGFAGLIKTGESHKNIPYAGINMGFGINFTPKKFVGSEADKK
jgi:hypothetical protein